jgi:HNH endonuclease
MPFSESIKIEAKKRANYRCVVCQGFWVEVHHIHPEGQGGPSTLDNAAPLCTGCHHQYGGNPELRKQLREMRDHWWERCKQTQYLTVDAGLAQKVDDLQISVLQGQKRQDEALAEMKGLFLTQLNLAQQQVLVSGTVANVLTAVNSLGSGLPPMAQVQTSQPFQAKPSVVSGAFTVEPILPPGEKKPLTQSD